MKKKADYTNTFCHLMNLEPRKNRLYEDNDFMSWKKRWEKRLLNNNNSPKKYLKLMKNNNPVVIPRNHKIEEALEAANQNNLEPIKKILKILEKPYDEQIEINDYQLPSSSTEKYQTFCGT